jgi:hypothetical protein
LALSLAPSASPDRLPRLVMLELHKPDVQFCTSNRSRPASQPGVGTCSCNENSHGLMALHSVSR